MHGGTELFFEGTLDKDRLNGATNEEAARAKSQAGQWTGGEEARSDGQSREAKGKAEKPWGDLNDAARNAKNQPSNRAGKRPAGTRSNRASQAL